MTRFLMVGGVMSPSYFKQDRLIEIMVIIRSVDRKKKMELPISYIYFPQIKLLQRGRITGPMGEKKMYILINNIVHLIEWFIL